MRVLISALFLTFVLTGFQSLAAPQISTEIEPIQMDSSPIAQPLWRTSWSPYNYSIYFGGSGGNYFEKSENQSDTVFGFRFAVDSDMDHAWDFNAEVSSSNLIGVHIGKRTFIAALNDVNPYFKWSLGTHMKAADGLTNFVEIKRFQVRGSMGVANLLHWDQHLYIETGLGIAVVGIEYFAVLGLNFSF